MPDDLSARVDAFLDRVAAIRWMQPDAAMDACDPDALQWCADRVEEHLAALGYTDEELPSPLVTVERDLVTADDRWTSLWTPSSERWRKSPEVVAAREYLTRLRGAVVPTAPAELLAEWSRLTVLRSKAATRSAAPDAGPLVINRDFLGFRHAEQALFALVDRAKPSPWSPLLCIWDRGVFPLSMPDRSMMLFVPHATGAALKKRRRYSSRREDLSGGLALGFPSDWVMLERPSPAVTLGVRVLVSAEPPRPRPQPRRPRRGEEG